MKKWLVILCIALLVLFLGAATAWLWLTRTESGARWAMARGAGAVERLEYDALEGDLASGVTIDGLAFAHAGTRVTANRLELAAHIDLFAGPLVTVRHLRGQSIDIHLPETEPNDEPAGEPFDLSTLAIPVEVIVEELELRQIGIHSGDASRNIERIALVGGYGERIAIDRLEIAAEQGRLTAEGEWALARRGSGRLRLDAETTLAGDVAQSARVDVEGRLDALDLRFSSQGPARLDGGGRIRNLPAAPTAQIELTGAVSGWPDLPLAVEDLVLELDGGLSDWRAESSARVTGDDVPPGEWTLALSGSTQSLTIESLDARLLDGRVTGSGSLDWHEDAPTSQARLQIDSLDLTPLYPQWPNQGRLSGELTASTAGGVIDVESLSMQADPGDLRVTGSGRIDPAADRLDATLEWQQFAWPPITDDAEPLVASESGRLSLEGRISDWRAQLEAVVDSPRTPSARIEAEASGSDQQANIQSLNIDAGESGSLSLDGQVAWTPQLSTRLNVALDAFDPGVLVNQLPGRIDGRARIDLVRAEGWQADLGIETLSGELRGQPLRASGQLAWADARPESADLVFDLGDNRIALSNSGAANWRIELDAIALGQLWPTLEGSATLAGELDPAEGQLALQGGAENLRFEQYNLEQADIDLSLRWRDQPRASLSLSARNLDLQPWDRVESLQLSLEGGCDAHEFDLQASGARGTIDLAAEGRLSECLESETRWRGRLTRLALGETLAGDWALAQPLPLTISAGNVRAGAACLARGSDEPARLCLETLEIADTGRVVTRVERVPVDLLLLPLDPVFSLTTPLSGRIEAGWDGAGLTRLDGRLRLDSGVFRAIGGEEDLLAVDSVQLDLIPGEGTALRADLRARLEGATEINGQAELADLRNLADTQLDGEARLDLPEIAAFAHLIPQVDRVSGAASGRIGFEGPITGPSISGRVALQDGRVVHAPLGLDVHAIELEVAGSADRATLSGRAQSGDGQLSLSGRARLLEQGWRLESRIEGERFAFAGADWLELSASPQIDLRAEPELVRIDGDIAIDRLRAGLPPGTAERIEPSPDVEVVGESPDDREPSATATRRVEGRLGIDLGEDASLSTEGFRTELAGGIELLWNGPPRPQGEGTIRLPEGAYRTYGQNLEISGGEVIFTGQPIDNPRLDIRAVREIFGDPEVEAAGVHIAGSAREPDIQLYTDPPTSQEKALAYVVTGSDFDHAGGQGALNVGLYLLPNLFVSYGVGLFETGNVLSGRYEFSRHWGVRVVSGERDTGVDLSYTVNN